MKLQSIKQIANHVKQREEEKKKKDGTKSHSRRMRMMKSTQSDPEFTILLKGSKMLRIGVAAAAVSSAQVNSKRRIELASECNECVCVPEPNERDASDYACVFSAKGCLTCMMFSCIATVSFSIQQRPAIRLFF